MKSNMPFMILLGSIIIGSCHSQQEADLIITNTTIYTVDEEFSVQEAMAVKEGKILAVGTDRAIRQAYRADQVISLDGKYVYPGFIDAHCHFLNYGRNLQHADLTGTGSFEEILEILQGHHKKHPSSWIIGRGWDQNDWPVKEPPTRKELDRLFPDTPVLITRIDGHAALANRKALEMAGITGKTEVDGGEVITRNGVPTGVLIDNAISLVSRMLPRPGKEETARALLNAQEDCLAVGLTSVHEAGLGREEVETIDSLQNAGKLKMRIYVMLNPSEVNFDRFIRRGPYQTDRLNVRSIKLFCDGALGSRGALLLEPYSDDPGNHGLLVSDIHELERLCREAYKYNYQVCTHAIGDSANRLMLNLYGKILEGPNDRRWRIEHAQIIHPEDFDLFGKYHIIPSIQTTHATSDMYWAEDRLGPERMKGAYAFKQLLEQNGWLPNGSDFPVEHINPLFGFYAGVARKDHEGYPPEGFQTENALTREQALRAMTVWAAKAAFEEDKKGSLVPGKWADFVVLDQDLMNTPIDSTWQARVLMTWIAGEQVFSAE